MPAASARLRVPLRPPGHAVWRRAHPGTGSTLTSEGVALSYAHLRGRIAPVARATLAWLLLAACDDAPRAIDPFPIRLDLARGPAVAAVDVGDGPVPAIIDTLSALTLLDP